MPDPAMRPSLAAELADMKRRMGNLERTAQLPNASMNGLVISNMPAPLMVGIGYDPATGLFTASGSTFEDGYFARLHTPPGEVAVVEVDVNVAASTTGELRLKDLTSGLTTATQSLAALDFNRYRFEWIHPAKRAWNDTRPGRADRLYLSVQIRRTTGAGTVSILPPVAYITSLDFTPLADVNGHITVL